MKFKWPWKKSRRSLEERFSRLEGDVQEIRQRVVTCHGCGHLLLREDVDAHRVRVKGQGIDPMEFSEVYGKSCWPGYDLRIQGADWEWHYYQKVEEAIDTAGWITVNTPSGRVSTPVWSPSPIEYIEVPDPTRAQVVICQYGGTTEGTGDVR